MKCKILAGIIVFLANTAAYADKSDDLATMLSDNLGKVLISKITDFNRDGYQDMVVVTENGAEDGKYGYRRTLFVFLNDRNKRLHEIVRNDNVIACSKCSSFEPEPDPFADRNISVAGNKILITQNFDIRFHPSVAVYKFTYRPKTQTFKTVSAKHVLYELAENGKYKRHISNHVSQFGKSLDVFNPDWPQLIGIQDKFYSF